MRRFVIGDIHGCAKALRTVIDTIAPTPDDEIVFLGDYVDRGPDSRNVVDQVIELQSRCRTVLLRGNHEIMLQGVLQGCDNEVWLANGGRATVNSYGGSTERVPQSHLDFFRRLRAYYETEDAIFVHAGYDPNLEMRLQTEMTNYWMHLDHPFPGPHVSGKRVFVGHTPQGSGNVLDIGHLVCLDTYCFGGGYLSAYELFSEEIIQVDRHGHLRRSPIARLSSQCKKVASTLGYAYKQLSKPRPDHGQPKTAADDAG